MSALPAVSVDTQADDHAFDVQMAILANNEQRPWHGVRRLRYTEWGLTGSGRWLLFLSLVWLPIAYLMMTVVTGATTHLYPSGALIIMAATSVVFGVLIGTLAYLAGVRLPLWHWGIHTFTLELTAEHLSLTERSLRLRQTMATRHEPEDRPAGLVIRQIVLARAAAGTVRLEYNARRPDWQVAGSLLLRDRQDRQILRLADRWVPNNKDPLRQTSLAAWIGEWWPVAAHRSVILGPREVIWSLSDASAATVRRRDQELSDQRRWAFNAAALTLVAGLSGSLLLVFCLSLLALALALWDLARGITAGPPSASGRQVATIAAGRLPAEARPLQPRRSLNGSCGTALGAATTDGSCSVMGASVGDRSATAGVGVGSDDSVAADAAVSGTSASSVRGAGVSAATTGWAGSTTGSD